ncbi:CdiA family toxin C-terminal domain-containing protein [Bacillus sp. XF8]|uniref:CdiA family toxin C-terminal domain-containing protein n=1 Tax=Bacillus sp. XF8 TaxID=2819289 RepID=UPI0027DD7EB3|nr:CdiA family toxin C-terminal domain-containing protein [Bacillus sp. XF8]
MAFRYAIKKLGEYVPKFGRGPSLAMEGVGAVSGGGKNLLKDAYQYVKDTGERVFGSGEKDVVKDTGKNISFRSSHEKHLIEVEDIVRRKNKGVVGGHNLDNFEKAFRDLGWDLKECIISKNAHPSVPGVYEVKYQIPAIDRERNVIAGQYKNIPNPKTVYDPKVISDKQMLAWGREAMQNGVINGREITGYASNGLKFKGFIENGEITNFFPTLK